MAISDRCLRDLFCVVGSSSDRSLWYLFPWLVPLLAGRAREGGYHFAGGCAAPEGGGLMAKPKDPVMGGTARAELAAACAILDRPGSRTGKELRQARKHLAFARDFSTALYLDVERLLILQELGLPEHAQGVSAEDLAPRLDLDVEWLREALRQLAVSDQVRCLAKDRRHLFQHLDHPVPPPPVQQVCAACGRRAPHPAGYTCPAAAPAERVAGGDVDVGCPEGPVTEEELQRIRAGLV